MFVAMKLVRHLWLMELVRHLWALGFNQHVGLPLNST